MHVPCRQILQNRLLSVQNLTDQNTKYYVLVRISLHIVIKLATRFPELFLYFTPMPRGAFFEQTPLTLWSVRPMKNIKAFHWLAAGKRRSFANCLMAICKTEIRAATVAARCKFLTQ